MTSKSAFVLFTPSEPDKLAGQVAALTAQIEEIFKSIETEAKHDQKVVTSLVQDGIVVGNLYVKIISYNLESPMMADIANAGRSRR